MGQQQQNSFHRSKAMAARIFAIISATHLPEITRMNELAKIGPYISRGKGKTATPKAPLGKTARIKRAAKAKHNRAVRSSK